MARIEDQRDGVVTAAQLAQRAAAQREVASVKVGAPPLGGAPPIPAGKLRMALPQPDFGGEQPLPVQEPPAPRVRGVGDAYQVNQAVSQGQTPTGGPVSLAEGSPRTNPLPGPAPDAQAKADDAERELVEQQRFTPELDLDLLQAEKSPLLNPARRKAIEARLGPMAIEDLIVKREIAQTVPIVPGQLEVSFRTFTQREHLFCLSYVYEHPGSTQYVIELFNTAKVVCCLVAVNGKVLPEHRKNVGERNEDVDREAFLRKFAIVTGWPTQLLADVSVQGQWFNERVNKLFTAEHVKNG